MSITPDLAAHIISPLVYASMATAGVVLVKERAGGRTVLKCMSHAVGNGLIRVGCLINAATSTLEMIPAFFAAEYRAELREFK